jgi:tRNA A-37 threonylcarbamoyl transferase component Bud32
MQSFHDEGLVHGDLREPNILCDGEKMMLIDFDWGGEVGKACYPHARLCHDLMEGRDCTSPQITKGDGRGVLQNTLLRERRNLVATV